MEKVKIYPAKLAGTVQVPSSKSMGHREIICAGLAGGTSIVDNISMSQDIEATMRVLRAMNVSVDEIPSMIEGRKALQITGTGHPIAAADNVDCGESGSTLRFFIPLGANLGCPLTFIGHGKLVSRPLQAYYDILDKQFGITDLRGDKRIDFIGGIRGLEELKKLVDNGSAACALALYPVSMEEIFRVADSGNIMPPKATWFEPKLRSGVVIHELD